MYMAKSAKEIPKKHACKYGILKAIQLSKIISYKNIYVAKYSTGINKMAHLMNRKLKVN